MILHLQHTLNYDDLPTDYEIKTATLKSKNYTAPGDSVHKYRRVYWRTLPY